MLLVQNFSAVPAYDASKLKCLTPEIADRILGELKTVDANFDGRLDADELKKLLRKHKNFTDDEIVEMSEFFYAGRSGGSVSFDRFLEALDHVAQGHDAKEVTKALKVDKHADEYFFVHDHGKLDWNIQLTHTPPPKAVDKMAFYSVKAVRSLFDVATGWNGPITTDKVMNRTIYLETIAAVPGMVAAIVRHFKSLRTMEKDGGMIQMFLDEANNERMHLLTFVRMKNPGLMFRAAVIGGQFGFGSLFMLAYILSPRFCHRFVGYVEEEACSTYTKIIKEIENATEDNPISEWRTQLAPAIARSYWKLGENGTVLDLMYAVRADEAEHRDVNHVCSEMKPGMANPVVNTEERLNTMMSKYVQDMMERDPEKPLLSQPKANAA
jgi:hypothetical protein